MPQPWIFALAGTACVVVSAALSGFYTSYLERLRTDLERRIRTLDDQIAWGREYLASGSQKLSFADLKLVLLQSTRPPQEVMERQLQEISNDILRGIVDRNSAATGDHPSEHLMKAWRGLAHRAGGGDPTAFGELSEISSGLLPKWAEHNNALVKERDAHTARLERMKHRAVQVTSTAVVLQILGLIVVLAKDLPK